MTSSLLATRAANIHARKRSARWSGVGHYHLDRWTTVDGAWLGTSCLVLVVLLYEPWLFGWNWTDFRIHEALARALLWLPVLTFAVNAVLFYRLLRRQTPWDLRPVPWVSVTFTLLAGLPLAGVVVLPAWRSLVERRPAWAFQTRPDRPLLLEGRVRTSWQITERVILAQIALLASFLLGLAGLLALGTGLGRIGGLHPNPWSLVGFAALHFLGLTGSRRIIGREIGEARITGLWRYTPWFWLLPIFGPVLAVGLGPSWNRSQKNSEGVVWSAHAERTSEQRSRGHRTLAAALTAPALARGYWRPRFGLPKSSERPRPGRAANRLLSFFRWQSFFLAVDAGVLILVANVCANRWPESQPPLSAAVRVLVFTATGLAGAGFAVWLALLVIRAWRQTSGEWSKRWQEASFSFGLGQLALLAGSEVPLFLATEKNPRHVWALMSLTCVVLALVRTIFVLTSLFGHGKERNPWTWAVVWLALGWVAALATRESRWLGMATLMLAAFVFLSPLWHLLLVRTRGDWLFWPVTWKQAFDPHYPDNLRWRLRLVALVAALPFGGLFVPLWPFVRARLAPAAARAWWEIRGEG